MKVPLAGLSVDDIANYGEVALDALVNAQNNLSSGLKALEQQIESALGLHSGNRCSLRLAFLSHCLLVEFVYFANKGNSSIGTLFLNVSLYVSAHVDSTFVFDLAHLLRPTGSRIPQILDLSSTFPAFVSAELAVDFSLGVDFESGVAVPLWLANPSMFVVTIDTLLQGLEDRLTAADDLLSKVGPRGWLWCNAPFQSPLPIVGPQVFAILMASDAFIGESCGMLLLIIFVHQIPSALTWSRFLTLS